MKALIGAELVNVAGGMIDLEELIRAATTILDSGTKLIDATAHFKDCIPRSMPYTEQLSSQITLLSEQQVGILVTLRANLASLTEDLSVSRQHWGQIAVDRLSTGFYNDLTTLTEAVEEFIPKREIPKDGEKVILAKHLRELLNARTKKQSMLKSA